MGLPEEAYEKMVLRATEATFFNTSPIDLSKLGEAGIKDNLETYIQSFSKDAREIFDHLKFIEFVSQLNDANLLYKVIQKFASTDARHLRPMLREKVDEEDDIDLNHVGLTHYRLWLLVISGM